LRTGGLLALRKGRLRRKGGGKRALRGSLGPGPSGAAPSVLGVALCRVPGRTLRR